MDEMKRDKPDKESSNQYVNDAFVFLEDEDRCARPMKDEAGNNVVYTLDKHSVKLPSEKKKNGVRTEHKETKTEDLDLKDEKSRGSSQIKRQVLCGAVITMTHVLAGTIIGLPGVILPQLTDATSQDIFLDTNQVAIFGSMVFMGPVVGSLLAGGLCTYHGQRMTLLLAMPFYLVMWLTMYLASAVWVLQLARALLGMTIGLIGSSSSTYLAEVTQPELRGRFISFQDVGRNIGVLIVYMIGSLDLTWRQVILICGCITTVPTTIGIFLLPNSPRWLVTRGREEEAYKALVYLRGPDHDCKVELQSIVDHFCEDNTNKKGVREQMKLMREPNLLYRTLLMTVLAILVQFTGNIAIVTYSVPIFQATDSSMNSYTSAVSIASLRVVGLLFFQLMVRHLGRKALMVISSLICSLSLLLIGLYFLLHNAGRDVSALGWLPLVCLLVFMPFVVIINTIFAMLRSEFFPNSLRAVATSMMFSVFCFSMFGVTQVFPILTETIGEHCAFWIFSLSCILVAVLVTLLVPETQSLTLEEIDDTLRYGKKIQIPISWS